MLRNYLIVAIRNLLRYKIYTLINVLGLAIGIACCLLILLFVQRELSYNRHHEKSDRIYRVVRETRTTSGTVSVSPGTSGLLGSAMERDLPEVETAMRMMMIGDTWMRYENKGFGQMFCVADPEIFNIFDFPLIRGNPKTALQNHFSVLITEEAAQKIFGKDDPVGKIITAEGRYFGGNYLITGVLKDMPENSSLKFDFLSATMHQEIPLLAWEKWQPDTSWRPVQTYVLLKPNSSVAKLEQKLQELMAQYMGEEIRAYNTYYLQPLTRIHLYSEADYGFHGGGDITQVYIFSSIAFFILLIACINFVNLTTARSINRAREVGLRKVLGASSSQLVGQFLGESIFLVFLSLILAMGFAELALPVMNNLTGNRLSIETLQTGQIVATLLGMGVLIGFLSGCYPALFVSSFQPITALKGQQKTGKTGNTLRKGLVICQFAISIVLITGTVIIYQQLGYMQNKKLGFNKDQIVVLPLFNIDRSLTTHYETVKQAFLEHPNVLKASASNATIAWFGEALQTVHPEGVASDEWQMRILGVDEDFLTTYEIEIAEGRRFSKNIPTDATEAYILNEAAVKQLGWTDPIGKSFEWAFWNRKGKVIGVVKDFHNRSLKEHILPVALCMWQDKYNFLSLKIRSENVQETMAFLEDTWKRFIPDRPFSATFLDDHLDNIYRSEKHFGQILQIFTLLAIVVASLGLLGLMSFIVAQRNREIGIRKILGASMGGIGTLLIRDFMKLVLIANLIAWPIAYYTMNQWLKNFAYRITISWEVFVLSGTLAFVIALATVGFQTIKAAMTNPVDSIRDE